MKLLALDPGLKGGYAVFYDGELITSGRMPMAKVTITYGITRSLVDAPKLAGWVRAYEVDTVVTEYQTAMPGQSSVATGTTFLNWGLLLALPMLCGATGRVVHPRVWKNRLGHRPRQAGRDPQGPASFSLAWGQMSGTARPRPS